MLQKFRGNCVILEIYTVTLMSAVFPFESILKNLFQIRSEPQIMWFLVEIFLKCKTGMVLANMKYMFDYSQ